MAKDVLRLKALIKRLKKENTIAYQIIAELSEKIDESERNFMLNLSIALDKVGGTYSTILNPLPETLTSYYDKQNETFEIHVNNILWIDTWGRLKTIFLNKPISTIDGTRKTDKIVIDNDAVNFKTLLEKFNRLELHLKQVSRSFVVNVDYFTLNENTRDLRLNIPTKHRLPSIKISKSHIKDFRDKKGRLAYFRSFRQNAFRSV